MEVVEGVENDGDDVHKPWTVDDYNKIAESLQKTPVEDVCHTFITGLNLFDEYDEPDEMASNRALLRASTELQNQSLKVAKISGIFL